MRVEFTGRIGAAGIRAALRARQPWRWSPRSTRASACRPARPWPAPSR
ncbi:MAG: hypothetical protein MZV70_50610 [Desulfobacterales bacterium]|nr:hypothetical protein [Desulfobacterales bacterium]